MEETEQKTLPKEETVTHIEKKANNAKKPRSKMLLWFTLALLIIGLAWLLYWFFYLRFHEYTDDAYANGNMININAAVSGSVVGFYADDTDLVVEGQLLVSLDPTPFELDYRRELAALGAVVLQVRQLYDTVRVNQAVVENRKALLSKAKYDFDNRQSLVASQAISNEDFIHARDDLTVAETNLRQAEEQLKVSRDAAGNTPLIHHPQIEEQKERIRNAYYRLQHCSLYAPATGYVAQRTVNVGQWVTPSTNLMAVIPKDYVWVDANYKETQLTYMRIGQPATVWFDLYGSKVAHRGKVLGIASGSGSVFSLIPPQNATGNWIKIVQRLAVRISLDPSVLKNYPMRLGISAEVDVDITNQDLPMLAQIPSKKPIGLTRVFDLDMTSVNQIIDSIMAEQLNHE
jgi:membrane fusion protein (multidrug efflux system)